MTQAERGKKIREYVDSAQGLARRSVMTAYEAGKLLIEAKDGVKHGQWMPFLKRYGIDKSLSARYMKLARGYSDISQIEKFESIEDALRAKRLDDLAREFLIHQANAEQCIKRIIEGYHAWGQGLCELKRQLKPAEWTRGLNTAGMTQEQAKTLMRFGETEIPTGLTVEEMETITGEFERMGID